MQQHTYHGDIEKEFERCKYLVLSLQISECENNLYYIILHLCCGSGNNILLVFQVFKDYFGELEEESIRDNFGKPHSAFYDKRAHLFQPFSLPYSCSYHL